MNSNVEYIKSCYLNIINNLQSVKKYKALNICIINIFIIMKLLIKLIIDL